MKKAKDDVKTAKAGKKTAEENFTNKTNVESTKQQEFDTAVETEKAASSAEQAAADDLRAKRRAKTDSARKKKEAEAEAEVVRNNTKLSFEEFVDKFLNAGNLLNQAKVNLSAAVQDEATAQENKDNATTDYTNAQNARKKKREEWDNAISEKDAAEFTLDDKKEKLDEAILDLTNERIDHLINDFSELGFGENDPTILRLKIDIIQRMQGKLDDMYQDDENKNTTVNSSNNQTENKVVVTSDRLRREQVRRRAMKRWQQERTRNFKIKPARKKPARKKPQGSKNAIHFFSKMMAGN